MARRLAPGAIGLFTGPSGSGKSVALRAFAEATGAATVTAVSTAARRSPIAMIRGDLDAVLATLAACGLGEARRMLTPAGLLSDGERARLALARTIAQAPAGRDIACDEFTSTLDRLTARSVCRCVRRAITPGQRLVCATAHDDVALHLDPDLIVYIPLAGPPTMLRREERHADAEPAIVA